MRTAIAAHAAPLTAADLTWTIAEVEPSPGVDPLVEALVDALAYRTLAQQALHRLHEWQATIARLERERDHLLAECRTLRAQCRPRAGVAR